MNSSGGEDWKKRLKSLGIVRKRRKKGEKKEDLLRREEGENSAVASSSRQGEAPAAAPLSFAENLPGSPRTVGKRDLRKVESGRRGEELAVSLLEENLLSILARNVRYPDGEIDIVALDGATTVFVEVKRRRDAALGTPAEAVTRTKRARIVKAARRWLAAHPARAGSVRFDVIAIRDDSSAVEWLRGAFDASR